uniref:F-box domain-containing protein n=1 Tax=Leersia perrieri TaxID=77586 RepID=A0A0D9W2N6_9ORYZ
MSQPDSDEDGDILSALPDCLLHIIMSFLPARQAVQTCLLSRRWRDLWRSMPCLDIDGDKFMSTTAASSSSFHSATASTSTPMVNWVKMENFTTNMLFTHNAQSLDRFRLNLPDHMRITGHPDDVERQAKRWILRGFRYQPKEIQIAIGTISDSIFRTKLPFLGATSARRLKRMQLSGLALGKLFGDCIRSWCPVLESMELKNCNIDFNEIVSDTIKSLAIVDCHGCHPQVDLVERKTLAVKAPNLTSLFLRYKALGYRVIFVDQMDSLVEASICQTCWHMILFHDDLYVDVLGRLLNVENLNLSCSPPPEVEPSPNISINVPTFHKMNTLRFHQCDLGRNLHILRSFLKNAPNLEKIILENCKIPDNLGKRKRKARVNKRRPSKRKGVIISDSQDSKLIRITYRDGDIKNLIELLLDNRRKLESNTIVITKF